MTKETANFLFTDKIMWFRIDWGMYHSVVIKLRKQTYNHFHRQSDGFPPLCQLLAGNPSDGIRTGDDFGVEFRPQRQFVDAFFWNLGRQWEVFPEAKLRKSVHEFQDAVGYVPELITQYSFIARWKIIIIGDRWRDKVLALHFTMLIPIRDAWNAPTALICPMQTSSRSVSAMPAVWEIDRTSPLIGPHASCLISWAINPLHIQLERIEPGKKGCQERVIALDEIVSLIEIMIVAAVIQVSTSS